MSDAECREYLIRLYWYTSADYLEANLRDGLVVLSEIANSNDPFEYLPSFIDPITKHSASEEARQAGTESLLVWERGREETPPLIVCLSGKMSSGAMWGHYAEEHRGVCLVFELPVYTKADEGLCPLIPVKYKQNRAFFGNFPSDSDREAQERYIYMTLGLKGEDWNYEHEFRALATYGLRWSSGFEKDCIVPSGKRLFFNGLMGYLKGIILGMKCDLQETQVQFMLEKYLYSDVIIDKAHKHYTEFKVYTEHFEDMHESRYEFLRDLCPLLYFRPSKHISKSN